MNPLTRRFILAAVYLGLCGVVGFWMVPACSRIFLESGHSLPWFTIKLLRQGTVGCLALGFAGAGILVIIEEFSNSPAVRWGMLAALCVPLAGAVAALLWPMGSL